VERPSLEVARKLRPARLAAAAVVLTGLAGCFDVDVSVELKDFRNWATEVKMCVPLKTVEEWRSHEGLKVVADLLYDRKLAAQRLLKTEAAMSRIELYDEGDRRCMRISEDIKNAPKPIEPGAPPFLASVGSTLYVGVDLKDLIPVQPGEDPAVTSLMFNLMEQSRFRIKFKLPEGFSATCTRVAFDPYDLEAWLGPAAGRLASFREAAERQVQELREKLEGHEAVKGIIALDVSQAVTAVGRIGAYFRLQARTQKAHCLLGEVLVDKGMFREAVREYGAAVAMNPRNVDARNGRGVAHLRLGNYRGAIADFAAVNGLAPKFAPAWANRCDALLALEQGAEALNAIAKALELKPDSPDYKFKRGLCRLALKQYGAADKDFSEIIRLDVSYDPGWWARGTARMMQGRHEVAVADFTEAIRLSPEVPEYWLKRSSAYCRLGSYPEAVADATRSIELATPPAPDGYIGRGWTYLWMGEFAKAQEDFETVLKIDPKNPLAFCNLAIYHWVKNQDKGAALDYYERAFRNGFTAFDELTNADSDGHFIAGLNETPEFKALVAKYRKP